MLNVHKLELFHSKIQNGTPSRDQRVILQDSAGILQNDYLASL